MQGERDTLGSACVRRRTCDAASSAPRLELYRVSNRRPGACAVNEPNMIQLLDGPCEEYAMIWILPVIFVFAYFFYKLVIRGGYMFAVGIVVTFFFSFIIAALSFGAACLTGDRKSTRLNSSHSQISHAV